jgi:hypothetical protein
MSSLRPDHFLECRAKRIDGLDETSMIGERAQAGYFSKCRFHPPLCCYYVPAIPLF